MKRKILGLAAIILALSLSAFNAGPVYKKLPSYFWFPLLSWDGEPCVVQTLVYQPNDPYNCASWAWGDYCSGAWTSYSGTYGSYFPAGDEVMQDFIITQ